MKKTIISHFYNEEYLLPWWLNHHKKYFDHGILINYDSNDSSVELCRSICPDWTVVDSRNKQFDAKGCDDEVIDIEKNIDGWRITLNTTEFLIGKFNELTENKHKNLVVKSYIMVDPCNETFPSQEKDIYMQNHYGYLNDNYRKGRLLSRENNVYNIGRHYTNYNTNDFIILWYSFSPWNKFTLQRKDQIKDRVPISDIRKGFGVHHQLTKKQITEEYYKHCKHTINIKNEILKFI